MENGKITRSEISALKKQAQTSKKVIISFLISFFIIGGLAIFIYDHQEKKDDNIIYNNHRSFLKHQNKDGILFKNIKCAYDGKDSLITYIIVNDTDKKIDLNNYNVLIKDKSKTLITKIVANVEQTLEPGKEVKMANSVVGVDLTDAYYMELKLKTSKK